MREHHGSTSRTEELWLVALFLSRGTQRFGERKTLPPKALYAGSWNEAYRMFYPQLGKGRPIQQFHNTLKNARDAFDRYVDSGREGWDAPLSALARRVLDKWRNRSEDELWSAVEPLVDTRVRGLVDDRIENMAATCSPATSDGE